MGQVIPHGEILLRNLRLLDLDDDFDWPAISKDTFTANDTIKNQKQRIQRAEWVLYKLFEKWSPTETEQVMSIYTVQDVAHFKVEAAAPFSSTRTPPVCPSTYGIVSCSK